MPGTAAPVARGPVPSGAPGPGSITLPLWVPPSPGSRTLSCHPPAPTLPSDQLRSSSSALDPHSSTRHPQCPVSPPRAILDPAVGPQLLGSSAHGLWSRAACSGILALPLDKRPGTNSLPFLETRGAKCSHVTGLLQIFNEILLHGSVQPQAWYTASGQ